MNTLSSIQSDLNKRLEELACRKTTPFCYHCYQPAPSGHCERCGSDDLMKELPGVGLDWGSDWVVRSILRDNLTSVNVEEAFEESVRECYPDTIKVAWLELDPVSVIKEVDPISWQLAQAEWLDNEIADEQLLTFDNGVTYYYCYDIEQFLENA